MTFTPRDYQIAAAQAPFDYWGRGGPGSPLIIVPTGGGKGPIAGMITAQLLDLDARVVITVHRKELINQDAAAVRMVRPDAPVAIYSASVGQKRIDRVTVAGIQSAYRNPAAFGHVDVMLVDECHLISNDENTTYRRFINALRSVNPDMRLVGLTATPYRLGQGLLTQGEGALFDCIAYEVKTLDLVDRGFLSPLVPASASANINTDGVKIVAGDFQARDLELAADLDDVNNAVASDVAALVHGGRKSVLVFGVGVEHAAHLRNALRMQGINTETVTGETPNRDALLAAFKRQELTCITSCDVLTTGFDAPCVDVIALVRPTKSAGLYVQMLGRGMRLHAGKRDCVVLDYGGNRARHGPITAIKLPEYRVKQEGAAPSKECPQCRAVVPAGVRTCVHCDFEFPPPEKKANAAASQLDPMREAPVEIKRYRVHSMQCRLHYNAAKDSRTLRVDYLDGAGLLCSEFIAIEHQGYANQKARNWWAAVFPGVAFPKTIEEAIDAWQDGLCKVVSWISVKPDGKYKRVVKIEFDDSKRAPGSCTCTEDTLDPMCPIGLEFGNHPPGSTRSSIESNRAASGADDIGLDPFNGDDIPF